MAMTATEVGYIFDTDMTSAQLGAFVTTASLIVAANCTNTATINSQVKYYLTAHLANLRDPRTQSEDIGDAKDVYQGKTGLGLDSTYYGQMCKMMDSSKGLDNLGKKKGRAYLKVNE